MKAVQLKGFDMRRAILVLVSMGVVSQFSGGYRLATATDPLPATGQTDCFQVAAGDPPTTDCATGECPGQDGLYQAGCLNDPDRFILSLGSNGVLDDPDMPVDDTVTDRCTGLMWQAYTADVSGDGMFETNGQNPSPDRVEGLLWCDALTYCEDLSFAGFNDWRLPNLHEGMSIVEYGLVHEQAEGGAINPKFHVVEVEGGTRLRPYWTSTHVTRKDNALHATVVDGGTDYETGDLLTVVGGVLSSDGSGIASTFKVNAIDPGGVVTAVGFYQPGKYTETAANPATTTTNSDLGSGATLEVTYNFTRVAYFVNYEWGSLGLWDTGTNVNFENGAYVRAVRSVRPAAGGGGQKGGGAGPVCAADNGNANGDASRDLSDAVYALAWLFQGGSEPVPFCTTAGPKEADCAAENGNTNGDESRDLSDVIYLLAWLFQGGPAPVAICQGVVPEAETGCDPPGNCCGNGVDDDQDGNTDCNDSDCAGGAACFESDCGDMTDNDEDGDTDCDDADCVATLDCLGPTGTLPDTSQTACQDGNSDVVDCAAIVGGCAQQDSLTDNGCDATSRFIDNGDRTISDTCTGLLWLKSFRDFSLGAPDWCAAMDICENTLDGEAGFDDWRLPNIRELQSIMDYGRARPALDTQLWYDSPTGFETTCIFSSTSLDADPASAFIISFEHGAVAWRGKTGTSRIPGNWTPIAVRTP